jgi:hypothetical protein
MDLCCAVLNTHIFLYFLIYMPCTAHVPTEAELNGPSKFKDGMVVTIRYAPFMQ